MKTRKIVLTGGPCGGKTTSIGRIETEFTEKGYQVFIVPEAATILINMGIKPFGENAIDIIEFQRNVIDLQMKLEEIADKNAKLSEKDVIILYDRGIIDDKAYVTNEEYKELLKELGKSELEVMGRYDLVIHLRTAALGKEEFYTLDNNTARTETKEEAREKDKKTLEAWLGHEKLKIIGNDTDFDTKIDNVVYEIYESLGKPYPIQRQYKYLIKDLDIEKLNDIKLIKLEIEQYIEKEDNKDIMYRRTTKDNESKYTVITKTDTNINNERITTERKITEKEYYENINIEEIPIIKNRYCFEYKDQYFRIDIFNDGLKILEIEETNKTKKQVIPDFIKIQEEITNNPDYRNSSLYQVRNQKQKQKRL